MSERVWWCEHGGLYRPATIRGTQQAARCYEKLGVFAAGPPHTPDCGWRLLVNPEALVVEKGEDGEWPKHLVEVLRYDVAALAEAGAVEILDALKVAYDAEREPG